MTSPAVRRARAAHAEVFPVFEEQMRRNPAPEPGTSVEGENAITRIVGAPDSWRGVTWSDLRDDDAGDVIDDQVKRLSPYGDWAEHARSFCSVRSDLDYVSHLARESARFAAAVAEGAPAASVPTCPEWDADDLLWHLAEVQWFWGTIVRQALQEPPPTEIRPERPAGRSELASFYVAVSAELVSALGSAAPQDRVWTWSGDHTVGFVRRRQAHEALIHRIDAELTVGSRTPMDAQLSDDGIDEALRVMYGHAPDWATFSPSGAGVVRLRAADTASTWLVSPGRLSGTEPDDGTPVDEACLDVVDDRGGEVEATLTGSAADLDCWFWRRPPVATLERAGDHRLLDQLEAVIRPGID